MNQREVEEPSKLDRAELLALPLVFFLVLANLMWPPAVGVANNGDFERLMHWGGLEYVATSYDDKYFGWINREFRFEKSPWRAWRGFYSSEAVFIKTAAIVGDLVFPGDGFDLRLMGIVHLAGFLAALWLLFRGWKAATGRSALWLLPGVLLLFCDLGYTAYFNSFYSEPAALIFLLAMAGAGLWLAADLRWGKLLLFCACAGLFITAKPQHFAFLPMLLLFFAELFKRSAERRWRGMLVAFALALVAIPFALHVIVPWYTYNARYQSVFYGVLKRSPAPEADLIALGLDPKFAALSGTTVFHPNLPIDIQSPAFRAEFFERINHFKIFGFYLTHPDRGLGQLRLTVASAFTLRVDYAGNFEKATGRPASAKAARWSRWSHFKERSWPHSLGAFAGYCLLLLVAIFWGYRRASPRSRLLREWAFSLWGMMIAAFVAPILGDGESDLVRHLFVFNAFYDLSLLLLSAWVITLVWQRWEAA